jgi:isoamylase/glycogen operon protein
MKHLEINISAGLPSPLGVSTELKGGVNFAFFSSDSSAAEILFFYEESETPFLTVSLSSELHKTDSIWHACIQNLPKSFCYTLKVCRDGVWTPELLDPHTKALTSFTDWNHQKNYRPKAYYFPIPSFDWQGVKKPQRPHKEWIIYEMHVRGFSNDASSHVKKPGTFLGVIEKIPHLKRLGVNAVELLPVFEFNESENSHKNPLTGETLCNFWGYSTVNFFCPMQRYVFSNQWSSAIEEFKTMVRALHKEGIAVLLDVVYNHTFEKGTIGPLLSFKGLDPKAYYLIDEKGEYYNFSGTGNTMNCNHPATSRLIIDSLSYWAQEMQVDGFRFDLASIFTRGEDGAPIVHPPLLEAIEKTKALKDCLFIAEAWDAAGLYQVGSFPGKKGWAEWNGFYRDTVRDFIKGTPGKVGDFANVLCGSQHLYWKHSPMKSINFITAHDGYSLKDLVSYQEKHNLANGEENQDGSNDNRSWNCGIEGPTALRSIETLRTRQMKNFVTSLLLSLGIPMILMGDEYGHTRQGNNNPYCQDNELNWFLWDELEKNADFFRFFKKMIQLRKLHSSLFCKESFFSKEDVIWHGKKPLSPDWSSESRFLAYSLKDSIQKKELFISFNAEEKSVLLCLPPSLDKPWKQIVDTSLASPYDFIEREGKRPICSRSYLLHPYSAFIAERVSVF